jgi:PAS domain S-box-containing protein
MEHSGLLVAVLDHDGRFLFASHSLCEACGCPEEGLRGRDWLTTCLPDDATFERARARTWFAGHPRDEELESELPGCGRDSARLVCWRACAVPDAPGAVALLGVDTTGRPANDAQLRRLARFFRALSDMGKATVGLDEPEKLYRAICTIAVESGHAEMAWIGLVKDDLVVPVAWGGGARQYTHGLTIRAPRGSADTSCLGPTAMAISQDRPYICNDLFADERAAPWRARAREFGIRSSAAYPIRRAGRVVGALTLYFRQAGAFDDMLTDLVQQMVSDLCFGLEHIDRDTARVEAMRTVRERELQLSGVVDTALDAIITVNARLEIVLFNRGAARMFGVAADEALGHGLDRFIPLAHRAAHPGYMARYARDGDPSRKMGSARELMAVRASGEAFPIEASISRTGEGDRLLMTVMARDVTQLRAAEKAELARTAAEAANRAKTEFLSRISHELRTPLNAVLGFAQLMRADSTDPLSAHHQEQVELVLQAGQHLRTLIDEMLDVSGIESGRMSIDLRDFELCELLDGALQMSRPHAAQCGVRLEAAYAASCKMLMRSDPARFRQVVLNLLSNAIKYNRRGGWVRVEAIRDPYFIHIIVRDNGLGMSPEQKAQLFQPFNRLGREHSTVEGTGIGLVLVRQLVGLMGGELTLESTAGEGTCVRVTLPATDGRPSAVATLALEAAADDGAPPEGVVLYIEDNPVNAILVEQLLRRWPKVRLIVASDGTTGLEQARALVPDVVLLDMQLPDVEGLSVLKQLKTDPATHALSVVALSANAGADEVRLARGWGGGLLDQADRLRRIPARHEGALAQGAELSLQRQLAGAGWQLPRPQVGHAWMARCTA